LALASRAATKPRGAGRPEGTEEAPVSAVRTTAGAVMAVPRFPFATARAEAAPNKASEERFHVVIDLVVVPVPPGGDASRRGDGAFQFHKSTARKGGNVAG
jgi:hypothetical protein